MSAATNMRRALTGARVLLALRILFGLLGLAIIVVTLLPLSDSDAGWIRIWDFPRPQVAAASAIAVLGLLLAGGWRRRRTALLAVAVAGAGVYQMMLIGPYTPLVPVEVRQVADAPAERCLSIFIANVHQDNRKSAPLLEMVGDYEPDIVLLMETDAWWAGEMAPLAKEFPMTRREIRTNTYGIMFFSRLPGSARIRHFVSTDIPSVEADLALPDGRRFLFFGVHPEPPLPTQSSSERDAELIHVAREVRKAGGEPAIVAGDLNDVAWSLTTGRFEEISGMLDPRVGRGLYPSFHANSILMRWPLDHLFHTDEFRLSRLKVLPDIGSDHFPVFASLCMRKAAD